MKKLVIITLGAVFALSLVSGIASAEDQPADSLVEEGDIGPLCIFDYCNYDLKLVVFQCVDPSVEFKGKGKGMGFDYTYPLWTNDPEVWATYCL